MLRSLCAAAFLLALTVGGCPSSTAQLDLVDTVGGSDALGGNPSRSMSTVAGGSVSSDAGDFSTELTARFPGCDEPVNASDLKDAILRLVNRERGLAGVGPVVRNDTLEDAADQYACEMISQNFFDHVNPVTGSTLASRTEAFDYSYRVVGENLAAGQLTPEQVIRDWMDSPDHRRNILDARFTELGVGVRSGGTYGMYWVQEFGLPLK